MKTEIKLCPMCKAKPVSRSKRHLAIYHEPNCFFAHPLHNANFNIVSSSSVSDQIKSWNTRPAEDALKAEVERLKEALSDMCALWEALGTSVPPVLNEQKYLNAKTLLTKGIPEKGGKDES